jgi:hypothetical protein
LENRQRLFRKFEGQHDEACQCAEHKGTLQVLTPLRIGFRLRGGECRLCLCEPGFEHSVHDHLSFRDRLVSRQKLRESRFHIAE